MKPKKKKCSSTACISAKTKATFLPNFPCLLSVLWFPPVTSSVSHTRIAHRRAPIITRNLSSLYCFSRRALPKLRKYHRHESRNKRSNRLGRIIKSAQKLSSRVLSVSRSREFNRLRGGARLIDESPEKWLSLAFLTRHWKTEIQLI